MGSRMKLGMAGFTGFANRLSPRAAVSLATFVLLAWVPVGTAAPFVPNGLQPGDTYHLIFATSERIPANFGSIAAADTFVNNAANQPTALTMGATYRAIISDSTTNAVDLGSTFLGNSTSPIYNVKGDLVANDYASMFLGASTVLANPVQYTEYAGQGTFGAWTATDSFGLHNGNSCSDWTGVGNCSRGGPLLGGSQWIAVGTPTGWAFPLRLYGISEQLVVPEPTGPSGLLFGLLSLLGWYRRGVM